MSEQDYKLKDPSSIDGNSNECNICASTILKENYYDIILNIHEGDEYKVNTLNETVLLTLCLKCSPLLIILLNHLNSDNDVYGTVNIKQIKERILNNTSIFDSLPNKHDSSNLTFTLGLGKVGHQSYNTIGIILSFDKIENQTEKLLDSMAFGHIIEEDMIKKIIDFAIPLKIINLLVNIDFSKTLTEIAVDIIKAPYITQDGREKFIILANEILQMI